ncbi:MAG: TrpB-like pyridoxal phosphate-dependent enzyme [Conexivisphaera sp.]|jgi:tryptophan synthase beta chain
MVDLIPESWYNVVPDLPEPLPPPMDPPGRNSSSIGLLNEIMPRAVLEHQFTVERWVRIPDEVRDAYANFGRPTPLLRAKKLEERIGTRARIYFKYEGALPTGSHKLNAALPQAYFAAAEGVEGVSTETGAGQWGAAVALASRFYGLQSTVFMVRSSYEQKRARRALMEMFGATVLPSPSDATSFGRSALASNPDSHGSLGGAMSEAIEHALERGWRYLVGSVLDVVLMYQSVIGLEALAQMEEIGEEPDIVIGCVGGGSNFAGLAYPIMGAGRGRRFVAAGATEVPKFSSGTYEYDFPDSAGILPMVKMLTLGRDFAPPAIYSGGLRYHGVAPSLSILVRSGAVEAVEYGEEESAAAGALFAEVQGIVPALESSHAVAAAIDEARRAEDGEVILFNMSGHGLLELDNYARILGR